MHGQGGSAGLHEPESRREGHVGKNVPYENTETQEEDHSDHADDVWSCVRSGRGLGFGTRRCDAPLEPHGPRFPSP